MEGRREREREREREKMGKFPTTKETNARRTEREGERGGSQTAAEYEAAIGGKDGLGWVVAVAAASIKIKVENENLMLSSVRKCKSP